MVRYRYRLRRDRLVTEDGVKYTAYGIDVYEGWRKARSIKDVSLEKNRMRHFVKQCRAKKPQSIDDAVLNFVEDESKIKEEPCFLK